MNPAIFSQVDDFLSQQFDLEDEVLRKTEESIRNNGMPEHSVSAVQGRFLEFMVKLCRAGRVVEVGTLGGYSTIWLGRALPEGGKLTSIEVDSAYAAVARNNIENAGLSDRVEILTGDAIEVLNGMPDETVDLFFMDADKPNYVNYFKWALKMSRPGTLIIADNVIREGKVLDHNSEDEKVIGVRNYLEMLSREKRVVSTVLQTVGSKEHDGIALSWVQ